MLVARDQEEETPRSSDAAIRPVLKARLLRDTGRDTETVLIEELGLSRGHVRVDIAVVNGSLNGYEIKSDRDSLRRLGTQMDVYGKVLDRANLVTGARFLSVASTVIPDWWGLIEVVRTPKGLQLKTVRRAKKNPARDPRTLVELLWADDALTLLEERDAARGLRGRTRRFLWDRVCEHFNVEEIASAVRARLKARSTNQVRR
jgi:hypothetical protein